MVRKGVFFSLDAIIATILIFTALFLVSTFYVKKEQTTQLVYSSSDITQLISTIKVGDIDIPSVKRLLNQSNITDLNQTIIEQVLRFTVRGDEEKAEELLNITIGGLLPDYYNFGVWIEGYKQPIFTSSQKPVSQLISSKQMVSGIERGRAVEGLTARALLSSIDERTSSVYTYFGGYVGDGNITKKFKLPSILNVNSAYMELDINNDFDFYINGIFAGSFSPTNLNTSIDSWEINNTALFRPGNNTIEFRFNSSSTNRYIGGGYFKVSYTTSDILPISNETIYQFPGIDGIINLYDSFYVPGILQSVMAHLHYYNDYNIFFNIGNKTVYKDTNCNGEYVIDLYDSNFSSLNYSALSRKTIPIRLGTEAFEFVEKAYNADVVLITDLSGSMQSQLDNSYSGVIRSCDDPLLYNSNTRRISLAKCLDKEFINTIMNATGSRIGLVGFTSSASTYTSNLDYTKEQLISEINNYPDNPSGGTCICCAINRAYDLLSNSLYTMAIIIPKKSSWLYNVNYPLAMPPNDKSGNNWTNIYYNDSGWGNGTSILGFEKTVYDPYVDTNININSVVLSNNSYNASNYSLINYNITGGSLSNTYALDGSTLNIAYSPASGSTVFYDGFETYYGTGAYQIDGNDINKAPGYWYVDDSNEEIYIMANYYGYPAYSGTDVLVFRDMDSYGYAETTINPSLYSNPKLSYWWRLGPDLFDSGEYANVRIWNGSWYTVATYDTDDSDNNYHYAEIDLSPYKKITNLKIRFGAKSSLDDERFYVDEVTIKDEPQLQQPEILFNSTKISYSEPFSKINARILFKSNASVNYAMRIYNFNTSGWESIGCDSGNVIADTWNDFWCSKSNPSKYISTDDKIRIALAKTTAPAETQTTEDFEDGNINGWNTGGNANWYATSTVSHTGSWSARAGSITHNQESWIEKQVEGPLTLTFYWKVSSEQSYDYLRFYIDDSEQSRISGEVDWQQKTYDIPAGTHTIRWRYTKDYSVSSGSDTGWIDDIVTTKTTAPAETQTTGDFEDGNINGWNTGGNANWYATSTVSHTGSWSARAGSITHNQESWIEKQVEGPLTLTFYWKVSSEQSYDYLRFYIDDSEQSRISGEVDWQQKTYDIPAGTHTIRWRYTKDYSVSSGSDTGWIDDILTAKEGANSLIVKIDLVQYYTTEMRGNYYFRKHFTINDKNAFSSARLYILSDDKADIYLNGRLVDNDSSDHSAEYWNRYKDINISYLNKGNNVFAVKLYNRDDRSAKFDLQLDVNSSRQRYMIVMSDGITGYHCGGCGADCSGVCDSTSGTYNCGGNPSDCSGSQCNTAINDAICSSCRSYNNLNSTVYSIGFGPVSECYNANRTLRSIADCGHGSYYASSDADELKEIYHQIAENILSAAYQAQFINVSGLVISPSVLYPDSYIELKYKPTSTIPPYGLIPLTIESEKFGNTITQGSFYIPGEIIVYDAKLTSYSGDKWTNRVSIKNSSDNWVTFYNLSVYSTNYLSLGDPYMVNIPTDLILKGRNNTVLISTAISPLNESGGSPDDKLIYTAGIVIGVNYTGVFEKAEGCIWNLKFDDGTESTMPIPSSYDGIEDCTFDENTNCDIDYDNDAITNAVCHLFKQLDFDNDGRLFVKFGPADLDIETYSTGKKIPYMWGPTVVEVRTWR